MQNVTEPAMPAKDQSQAGDLERIKIVERFGPYRKPTEVTIPKYQAIQEAALNFALLIHDLCPHSQQKAIALTHLEAVKMSANAAIAIHTPAPAQ